MALTPASSSPLKIAADYFSVIYVALVLLLTNSETVIL